MASVSGFGVRWTASGGHNHDLSALLYRYYVENRLVKSPGMLKRVGAWMRTGSNAQGILHEIRRETGRACGIRDIRNMIAQIKREQIAGTTVEERLAKNLEEFVASEGNSALVHVSEDTREAESVVFQSAGQKRLFAAFPEVVLVDCTHSTNRSRFILFSFVVHDIFGKGQYVNHALLHRETMDNMTDSVTAFKSNNPTWTAIRAFIVDKDFKERTILREHFADARILLCHYHVIKYFAKKVKALVRGTKDEKDEILHVLRALVYAKSRELYDALKILLAKRLSALMLDGDMEEEVADEEEDMLSEDEDEDQELAGELEDDTDDFAGAALRSAREDAEVARGRQHVFYRYFLKNWETCVEEWALFLRQNVAHLGNNTNNRIEAKWGAMKKVIKANMDMEQTVRGIRSLQEASEDEYLRQLVELRQPIDYSNDEELAKLIDMVSEHAFKLIEVEYVAVKNGSVHYSVRDVGSKAVLVSSSPSGLGSTEHTVDGQNFKCSCFFAQVRLLPCRHVFFYRMYKSLETVIPFGFIHRRWSVRNPVNNISSGVVMPGKYAVKSARATATNKMGEGAKFCKVMSVLKPIASTIASKTETDFNQLYTMCIKIGNLLQRGITPKIEDVPSDDEAVGGQSEGEADNTTDGTTQDSTRNTTSATPATPSNQPQATFVLPPVAELRSTRKNMKTSDAATQLARIQDAAVKFYLRTSTQGRVFSLSDVQDRLEHAQYTYEDALPVVAGVPILATTTASILVHKLPEHIVAAPPTIRFVLQEKVLTRLREKLYEAIDGQAIDVAYDEHIVKVGDGKGYLGVSSLITMDNFFAALGHVHAVIVAIEWVKKLNFATCRDLGAPFNSMGNPSSDFIERTVNAIKSMPLAGLHTAASYCVGGDMLSICGDTWLNTTSIVAILECLWSCRLRIGMITPDFAKLKDPVAHKRVLAAHFALEDNTDCVISIVNLCGSHWTAFFVNLETKICTVFDPLQSEDRVRRLRKLIKEVVEPALNKALQYRTYTDLQQNDSSSCGILCAMFLELMVEGKKRPKTIPPIGFIRARYMIMVSALLRTACNVAEA